MITETLVSQIAITLILFGSLFWLFYKPGKNISKNLSKAIFFAAVFIAGLLLNWIGVNYGYAEDHSPSGFIKFGSALIATLQMFVLNVYMDKIESMSMENLFYGVAYTLCYIAVILGTSSLIVQLLFKNLWNALSLFFLVHSSKETYIIAGSGVHQKTLLKHLTPEQKRNTIIIPNESNEEAKKEYIGRGFLVINGKVSMEILKKAGLFNSRKTALIAISDADVENLETARTITEHLKTLSDSAREKLRFSARIMYTNIERTEHFKFSETAGGKIQFFNPYEITARSFLFDNPITKFIPPSYIDTKTARLIKKDFVFLHVFIGFGKANYELLKQSIAANQILGADYHALVIDTSLQDSKSTFMNQASGLFTNKEEQDTEEYFPVPQEKYRIDFIECDVLSKEMYDTVINRVKDTDASAVIVSLGNVQLSAETAMEIRQRCYMELEEDKVKKTHIFVRAKEHSPIVDAEVLNPKINDNAGIRIEPFGFEAAILTLDHIIDMDMDILAKHIAVNYAGTSTKEQPERMNERINLKWCTIGNFKRESNRSAALSIGIKLNMMGFDLVYDKSEIQDASEEFKRVYGFEQAQKLRAAEDMERDAGGNIANTIRNNLARLEHQRWNAFHLVKGWMPMPKNMVRADSRQNERTKKHACITTFEGLDELAKLQAALKCKDNPALDYQDTLKKSDTMHYDCDQMDCLEDNLRDTKYRIARWNRH
ncbi:Rossmann-fold NAD(P)-binding domain-containing protein [Breznakiellaceae bacterium SP9]